MSHQQHQTGNVTVPSTDTLRTIERRERGLALNATAKRYLGALRTGRGITGLSFLAVLVALALLAPILFPGGYDQQSANAFAGPSMSHLFGTDELGRDLLVRALYGLRTDLSIIAVAVPISMILGTALGLVGALSRTASAVIQRLLDIILGPGWLALVTAIAIGGLPVFGRQARAALLEQNTREYVTAARALGVDKKTVLVRHILPNAIDPILVNGALFVVAAIFIEAGLSIIGLGIQPPEPSLGSLLNVGMRFIESAPMYILGPTLVLILLSMAFSLLSDALNDSVNRK
jgi:peptide/nickel transport system permease protein